MSVDHILTEDARHQDWMEKMEEVTRSLELVNQNLAGLNLVLAAVSEKLQVSKIKKGVSMSLGLGALVQTVLHSNQFASGGLLLMAVGAVGAAARKVPANVWYWLVRQASITVTVKDEDAVFGWIKFWFSTQKFTKKTRRIDLDTTMTGEIIMLPAPGNHWFWWKRRLFQVYFERTDNKSGNVGYGNKRTEAFTFFVIGRNRNIIKKFVEDITLVHRQHAEKRSHLYRYEGSYWEQVVGYEPRALDSVILPSGDKEKLLGDITKFLASKERYATLGVPYHRGYLLYGPPGTGKSSLAAAIAGKLNMGLYVINLNEFNDRNLSESMSRVSSNSVILFEDIDAMSTSVKQRSRFDDAPESGDSKLADKFGVTLSGLLNALDGVDAPSNVIYLMTTNRNVALDPALTRPGRIDYQLYMGEAIEEQKAIMFKRFFPDEEDKWAKAYLKIDESKTMAEFQGALLVREAKQGQLQAVNAIN